MQARRSLSPAQRNAVEAAAMGTRCCSAFLESIEEKLDPDEKLIARNLRDLARLSERKIIEAFPEAIEWFEMWESRGGA